MDSTAMLVRFTGLAITFFWTAAMTWLLWHDVLPAWTAQQPPKVVAQQWLSRYGNQTQFGIYDEDGHRIGGIWTRYSSGASTRRDDKIYVERFPLLGALWIEVQSSFNVSGQLDEIDIAVLGDWNPIRIHGERYHKQFAFQIDVPPFKQAFKLDLALSGTFSDMFRPFDAMPDLAVGQSWRMQVFNPIAAVVGHGDKFMPGLVKVVGRDRLQQGEQVRECFILESQNVRAWVECTSGLVLVQEITLPIGGSYSVRFEPYDAETLKRANESFDHYRARHKRNNVSDSH